MSAARGDVFARVAFAVLVLASLAALLVTQRLKHAPPLVQHIDSYPVFAPGAPHAHFRTEHLSFTPTVSDTVTVTITDSGGIPVATLLSAPVPGYSRRKLVWSGRERGGRPAPRGTYTAQIHLARRAVTFPLATFRLLVALPR